MFISFLEKKIVQQVVAIVKSDDEPYATKGIEAVSRTIWALKFPVPNVPAEKDTLPMDTTGPVQTLLPHVRFQSSASPRNPGSEPEG